MQKITRKQSYSRLNARVNVGGTHVKPALVVQ
jgi:hypothetical protein